MQKFDRIFDGEDMAVLVLVHMVDHCRERRRFAGAGRTGDENQSTRTFRQRRKGLRRAEFFKRQDLRRNGAKRCGRAALLVERVDAEAREIRNSEAEIALEIFFVLLPLVIAHDVVHHGVDVFVLHRRQIDTADVAVDPNQRRQSRRQMEVGSLVLDRESQKLGDVHL